MIDKLSELTGLSPLQMLIASAVGFAYRLIFPLPRWEIRNIRWLKDNCGDFWVADVFKNGKRHCITGSYYDVYDGLRRLPKDEQVISIGWAKARVVT